jgi:hypothetical protein
MAPQHALGGGSIGAEQDDTRAWPRLAGDDGNPAILQCVREIQRGESIFSVGRADNGEALWDGHRTLQLDFPRLRNEVQIRLSR